MPCRMDLALFDFDGTVSEGDTYTPFMRYVSDARRIRQGRIALAPWVVGYKLGLWNGVAIRSRVTRFVLKGHDVADVQEAGRRYAREVLPNVLRPHAMQRIAWHQARGDRVVIVSASLGVYLRPWCASHGLELICSELDARDGVLTGRYRDGDCAGPVKARRIRERYALTDYAHIHAYGDSREDKAMLALAHHRVYRWREQPAI